MSIWEEGSVGERNKGAKVKAEYELPVAAVTEAIVNAVVHRDYSSNGSVQVMLFRDRLEIWNPGTLPYGLTVAKLREPHTSIPMNPLLAEPMYLTGYIERMGTGTGDIIRKCKEKGLPMPEFIQEEEFRVIIWRKSKLITPQATPQADDKLSVDILVNILKETLQPASRQKLQEVSGLKDRSYFAKRYLSFALEKGYIELMYPDKPTHPAQRYILTLKGRKFLKMKQKEIPDVF